MNETQEAPDYKAIALQNMQEMELRRGPLRRARRHSR